MLPGRSGAPEMPSQVSGRRSVFDRFATHTSQWVSKGWFFTICVLVVVLWVPTLWVLPSVDTWQLVINTVTTIIMFLLVACCRTLSRAPIRLCNKSSTPWPTGCGI